MRKRELNACKQDIYSFLHFSLPTNPEPTRTRHDIHVRSALYVSIDTKRKVLDVVKKIGSEYMTATSYVENIVRQHLELYKDDINRIYKQKSTKNLI